MREFTKEEIKVMTPEEIKFWFQQIVEEQQVAEMRKRLLDLIDIQEAKEENIVKLRGD